MKLIKCPNGHFYDQEKYGFCPHCGGSGGNRDRAGEMITESFAVENDAQERQTGASAFGENDVTVSSISPEFYRNTAAAGQNYRENLGDSGRGGRFMAQMPGAEDNDNKTVSFINWSAIRENEEKYQETGQNAGGDAQRRETANPVVGWLVCISGSNYGKSFCLYSGKNFIGRDSSNDICLLGDNSVSRIKHAIIIYEPIQRQFFVQQGETSHELCYVNDKVVLANTLLADRDRITLGQNTLVFVPFCDDRYGWEIPRPE